MKAETSKQKTKNYILSNNVVINLGNLLQKRNQSRKKPNKSHQEEDNDYRKSSSVMQGSTTFTNVSNLETQVQQANLRNIEERGRFINASNLSSNSSSDSSSDNKNPSIRPPSSSSSSSFRDKSPYYNPADNAGAFGSIEGSDSFMAQGNNIPDTDSISTKSMMDNNSGDDSSEEEYTFTRPAKAQTRSQLKTPKKAEIGYTEAEVKIWLNYNMMVNPKQRLQNPTSDGREYRLLKENSNIYKELKLAAIHYDLL